VSPGLSTLPPSDAPASPLQLAARTLLAIEDEPTPTATSAPPAFADTVACASATPAFATSAPPLAAPTAPLGSPPAPPAAPFSVTVELVIVAATSVTSAPPVLAPPTAPGT
jgi:hypothetical protein